jgi:hypothetical protein
MDIRNIKIAVFIILFPVYSAAQFTVTGSVLNRSLAQDTVSGKTEPLKNELIKLKTRSDSIDNSFSIEKIYMQFDKPYYALGDTIWFKAYLLDQHLGPSEKSRIINLDIANDSNKVIKQYRLLAHSGVSPGDIVLDKQDFVPGTYTIRTYTNWMRNFKEDNFFYKTFYVMSSGEGSWLVNKKVKDTLINGAHSAEVKLQFTGLDKTPLMMTDIQLQVMDGNKNLYKQQFRTDLNGAVDLNFSVPQKAGNLAIVAQSAKSNARAVIPINLDRVTNADVQFLPEGGNLVAGLPARIAFKAIGEDGKGCAVSGIVVDHAGTKVAEFQSLHNGMGSFGMAVQAGESYTAKVTLPGGAVKDYPMPGVKNSGTVLKVSNRMESDSLEIFAAATGDLIQQGSSFYLIGKARGIVCYAAIISLQEGGFRRKIAKSLFPTGITHFTLMTTNNQPLNERLVFIGHHDNLNIAIIPDKQEYSPRDSVTLNIKVTDRSGKPVAGNFSLAVTDNAQVKMDTINNGNIISTMLLTSGLKGYVESPGYYSAAKTSDAWQALDNLLLTQGWVGYDWQRVFNPPAIVFQPEKEFLVKGKVVNVFNKPVKGTDVLLLSKSPAMLLDTATDKEGRFVFDRLPKVDTPIFLIRAVNKRGRSFNVGIKMDDIEPPLFNRPFSEDIIPWNVNSSPESIEYNKINVQITQARDFPAGSQVLKEVTIKAKKIVHGSQNLNGPGNADLVLDEKDMEKAGKKTWLQLLQENIPGFREGNFHMGVHTNVNAGGGLVRDVAKDTDRLWYFVKGRFVRIFVDGYELDSCINLSMRPQILNEEYFLKSHDAEDIKGIELNLSPKYRSSYELRFGEFPDPNRLTYAFIEITTRSGHGPFFGNTPGMYLYKPLAISTAAQFYKPKYNIPTLGMPLPDMRSTIDWEPNIITNLNGEATVSFYTADTPAAYTLTMEGIDGNGRLGYTIKQVDGQKPKDKTR